jgi:type II secretory pathway component PulJ
LHAASRNRTGYTLVELMISSGLLLLMLGGAYQALVVSSQYQKKLQDTSQIQQETMTVLSKLQRALAAASAESIEVSPDLQSIRFVSAENDQGYFRAHSSGSPLWQRWICYYQDGNQLVRKEDGFPSTPTVPLTLPLIDDIKLDTSYRTTVLSKQVQSVQFLDGATTLVIRLQTLSSARRPNGQTQFLTVHLPQ